MKIMIVDDQLSIREMLEVYLKNEGYEVIHAENGLDALHLFQKYTIDCIVLDLMMPKMTGEQFLMEIRKTSQVPVIILSAKDQDLDKISGLTIGADDYLTKPFNPLELVARIKSIIRRTNYTHTSNRQPSSKEIYYRGLELNKSAHTISYHGTDIKITPKEFEILLLMLENQGLVFSGEQIYQHVWKEEFIPSMNTIMVHIRNLRDKLLQATGERIIETVWGVGYKIEKD